MWGELVGASCHKYGASWLGRVGFGANRQIFLDTIFPFGNTMQQQRNQLVVSTMLVQHFSTYLEQ